jgi:indolepyruvate ferredoxin oxidoreductase alpha subunit
MTGHQEHPGTGRNARREPVAGMDIAKVAKALGAKNVAVVNPNNLKEVKAALDDAYSKDEPSVIITRWPCVLKPMHDTDYGEFGSDMFKKTYCVDDGSCVACKLCIKAGCPALAIDAAKGKPVVDKFACVGCSVCAQICPKGAIKISEGEK